MAWDISRAGQKVISLLQARGIAIDPDLADRFTSQRIVRLFGYNCMVANVMSPSSFRLRVSTDWFSSSDSSKSKPKFRGDIQNGFEFQLIPAENTLFALYYLEIRDYALELERDRNRWFKEPWWGARVDESHASFVWEGGNTKSFPLTPFCSAMSLFVRKRQYEITDKA